MFLCDFFLYEKGTEFPENNQNEGLYCPSTIRASL